MYSDSLLIEQGRELVTGLALSNAPHKMGIVEKLACDVLQSLEMRCFVLACKAHHYIHWVIVGIEENGRVKYSD
jgi:hypothetical protein